MIDIKHLVENVDRYERELEIRFMEKGLAQKLAQVYKDKNSLKVEVDQLRSQKNQFNKEVIALEGDQKMAAIAKMKEIGENQKELETQLSDLENQYNDLIYRIPNLTWDGIPVGPSDEDNVETDVFGEKPNYDFEVKNYYELPCFVRDYKSQKGVEAVGTRGYYMTGQLAKLQRALFDWVQEKIESKGFEYVIPPIMVNEKVMYGTGFFPNSKNDFYTVNPQEDNLFLVGSSEPPLMYLYNNEALNQDEPVLMMARTDCFRREAGSHGKDTQGGIRVHQFPKIEMVAICDPVQSENVFEMLTETFNEIVSELGLHFHYLEVSTGDQSMKNHRMIDIEAWFPAQGKFREVCSSSNCTDYQTRNLGIKWVNSDGEKVLAHSLNCTGVTNRALFAIMEQFQNVDGSVNVPGVLQGKFGEDVLR